MKKILTLMFFLIIHTKPQSKPTLGSLFLNSNEVIIIIEVTCNKNVYTGFKITCFKSKEQVFNLQTVRSFLLKTTK